MNDKDWDDYLTGVNTGAKYNYMSEFGASHHSSPRPMIPGVAGSYGGVSSSGDGFVGKGILGFIMTFFILYLVYQPYAYSAKIFFDYWIPTSQYNWIEFWGFSLVEITFLCLGSYFLGAWLGFGVGLLFFLPILHSFYADTDFHLVVFGISSGDSSGDVLRGIASGSVALLNGAIAREVAGAGKDLRLRPGYWWRYRKKGEKYLIASLGAALFLIVIAIVLSITGF